jgi:uncharacterized membrane protein YfcA
MQATLPINELLFLAAAIIAGGAVAGLLAGLFGVGGGGVIVPVLYEIFGFLSVDEAVRMQLCVGTSLAIILPTSLRSFSAHRARGIVPTDILWRWAPSIVAGVVIGGLMAAVAPPWVLKVAFVIMATLIAFKLFWGQDAWKISDDLPRTPLMTVYGLIVGLYSALMGVGGGSVSTAILLLYGRPIHQAVALSAGVGVIISIVGTVGFVLAGLPQQALLPPFSLGFVSLIGVALMAPIAGFVAPYGARLAHNLPRRKLEIAFGCFLLAIGLRFLASLFW